MVKNDLKLYYSFDYDTLIQYIVLIDLYRTHMDEDGSNDKGNCCRKYFSETVLSELVEKPPRIKLRKCRCGTLFDGTHTHQINLKTNKFYGLCEKCRKTQAEYRKKPESKAIKAETRKLYNQQDDVKEKKRESDRKIPKNR